MLPFRRGIFLSTNISLGICHTAKSSLKQWRGSPLARQWMFVNNNADILWITIFFPEWYWHLNSGIGTCKVATLPLKPCLQPFFALIILEIGSHLFCPGWPGLQSCYFIRSTIAVMTGTYHHHHFFSIDISSHELFCLSCPVTKILPISASSSSLQASATLAVFWIFLNDHFYFQRSCHSVISVRVFKG